MHQFNILNRTIIFRISESETTLNVNLRASSGRKVGEENFFTYFHLIAFS